MADWGTEEKESGYGVGLLFLLCKRVPNVDSVKPLAHLVTREGFHPSPAKGGREPYIASDIDALVDANFRDWETKWEGKDPAGIGVLRTTGFPLFMEEFPPNRTRCAFDWTVRKGEHVRITLSGQVWASCEEQKVYQEPFAQRILAIALELYPLALPVYGFIADPDVDPHPWKHESIARRQEIVTLNWVNFFGPEYVKKYGREMLASIPGWRIQDLPDGGLLYQSRPNIVVEDKEAHRRWQQRSTKYLASHGIQIKFNFA
jgi:hypothetical protein